MATTQVHGTPDQTPSGTRRRVPMALVTWVFVILILSIVVVLLVVKITRGTTTVQPPPVAPAATGVVRAMASLPDAVFDAVGAPPSVDPGLALLTGQPALSIGGRRPSCTSGAEFCPFCAAQRWALVAALDRFGSFSHLGAASSSDDEVFPGTYVLVRRDHLPEPLRRLRLGRGDRGPALGPCPRRVPQAPRPTPLEWALVRRYDTAPFVPGTGTLPFVDVNNRLVESGSGIGFSPGVLRASRWDRSPTTCSRRRTVTPRPSWLGQPPVGGHLRRHGSQAGAGVHVGRGESGASRLGLP